MEYLEGRPLSEVIRSGGLLAVPRALRLGIQIAEGLSAAHSAGVIHRDVKPQNIMVAAHGDSVKLMDFGIARLGDAGDARMTRTGTMMGTPAYMSPEQIEGREISDKTDIYAFGIVLYEMLAGTTPFTAPTPTAVLTKQLRDPAPPLRATRPDVPPLVEQVILQALEKEPKWRQDSMADVVRRLRAAAGAHVELEPVPVPVPVPSSVDSWPAVTPPVVTPPHEWAAPVTPPGVTPPAVAAPSAPPPHVTHHVDAAAYVTPPPVTPPYVTLPPIASDTPTMAASPRTIAADRTIAAPPLVVSPDEPDELDEALAPRGRGKLIAASAAFVVLVGVGAWLLWPPSPPVTPTPVERPSSSTGTVASVPPSRTASPVAPQPATPPAAPPASVTPPPVESAPPPVVLSQKPLPPKGTPPTAPPQRADARVTAAAPQTPETIRAAVEQRLGAAGLLRRPDSDESGVVVKDVDRDGVVTLVGVVRDTGQKETASRLAREVNGVRRVVPRVIVSE